ncbi:hypothetical protein EV363DRAFT_16965, partial [Boletus edulis]
FDGETQRHFSSVRFILYFNALQRGARHTWVRVPSRMSGIIHVLVRYYYLTACTGHSTIGAHTNDNPTDRDHDHHTPQNDPALPPLTVAFGVCLIDGPNNIDSTLSASICKHDTRIPLGRERIRIVRVIRADDARPRITISYLATELLTKIFFLVRSQPNICRQQILYLDWTYVGSANKD